MSETTTHATLTANKVQEAASALVHVGRGATWWMKAIEKPSPPAASVKSAVPACGLPGLDHVLAETLSVSSADMLFVRDHRHQASS
jgi:hypothetical protein